MGINLSPKLSFEIEVNDKDIFIDFFKNEIEKIHYIHAPIIIFKNDKLYLKFKNGIYSKYSFDGKFSHQNKKGVSLSGDFKILFMARVITIIGLLGVLLLNIYTFLFSNDSDYQLFTYLLLPIYLVFYSWDYYRSLQRMNKIYLLMKNLSTY